VALNEHFGNTCSSPEISVDLKRRMSVEHVRVGTARAEEEAQDNARRRLARARARLRAIGALVGGEIGPEDPLAAVTAALRRRPYDLALVAA
jgi:hypothetical protein